MLRCYPHLPGGLIEETRLTQKKRYYLNTSGIDGKDDLQFISVWERRWEMTVMSADGALGE